MKKILLVGDSISLDYGPALRGFVRPDLAIFGKPGTEEAYRNLDLPVGGNGGDSSRVLAYVTELRERGELDCDWFFFNCGLHDIKRERPEEELQVDEESYRANLQAILDLMKAAGVSTVFINTTQADGSRYPVGKMPFTRRANDGVRYNEIAEEVMDQNGVPVVDLYGFTASIGKSGNELFRDHTHFRPEIITLQAAYLAGVINTMVV